MTDALLPGSAKSEEQHSREICIAGRWLYERGYIVACEGNLSVRLDENRILNTPTCMNKGTLSPEDLVITDLNGTHISGKRKVSSEVAMHLLFYRMRPDVQAICHAHPPTATGFAVAGRALDQALLPEVIIGLGQIPLVHYATPGTPELSAAIEPFVPHYDALLLANHGAVTCGPYAGGGDGRRTTTSFQPRSSQADGLAVQIFCRAAARRRSGPADNK
jgi:L-fuculose-phosphate aldolase